MTFTKAYVFASVAGGLMGHEVRCMTEQTLNHQCLIDIIQSGTQRYTQQAVASRRRLRDFQSCVFARRVLAFTQNFSL